MVLGQLDIYMQNNEVVAPFLYHTQKTTQNGSWNLNIRAKIILILELKIFFRHRVKQILFRYGTKSTSIKRNLLYFRGHHKESEKKTEG